MRRYPLRRLAVVLALLCSGAAPPSPKAIPSEAIGQGSAPLLDDIRLGEHQAALTAPKIVGGVAATPGDDKWQVGLIRMSKLNALDRRPFCGGVLIDPHWVLTAAHCVDNGTGPDQFFVLAGTVDIDNGGSQIMVSHIWILPGHTPETIRPTAPPHNDLALLELAAPAAGPGIEPISLITHAQDAQSLAPDRNARVTGWGGVMEGGGTVRFLRFVDLQLHSNDECNDPVAYDGVVPDTMVCAGFTKDGGRDSCQGDSGGPLTVRPSGTPILGGIVSWGDGCARPYRLGVYTRVAPFTDWISSCELHQACRLTKAAYTEPARARLPRSRRNGRQHSRGTLA